MRRNSVTVEDVTNAKIEKRQKPDKLFLRSSSVGLAPGADGEQSPSPTTLKSPNRRESIKEHLLKFKAKAGKILEEVQNSKNVEESHGASFLSQSSEIETELSVVDEQAVSENSSQQLAGSKKESREQMRHRIRQNAQKAVERTRGNVQLNRRLARRPTVVVEELIDQNDIEAIDEQIEKTIEIGDKFLKEKTSFENIDRKNDEFFEKIEGSSEKEDGTTTRNVYYGRIEQSDFYNHEHLVKYTGLDRNIICGEFINRDTLKPAKFAPSRDLATESDQVYFEKAQKSAKFLENSDRHTRKYQQLDVFVDSIHFDHHHLWGREEIAVSKMRNLYFEQILKVHHMAQIEQHHLEMDSIEKSALFSEIHKNRVNLEKLWVDIQEIRSSQQFSSTQIRYYPEAEDAEEDWMRFGKIDETFPRAGKIADKADKSRIGALQKCKIQLVLFFNDIEVARTDWVDFGPFLIPVMRRFEMEIHSKTCASLYFVVLERQGQKVREIGKANIPLPSENDLEIALHEAVFENEQMFRPVGTSFGANESLKENGRILCRAIMENGELRSSEDRKMSQISDREQNQQKSKKFELIPSELMLGRMKFEDDEKKKLDELRENDRIQKKYVHRSAIDARRIAYMEFANMTRRRVMNRRRQVEKKYEELVKEQNIPTLSVALGQLFAPADLSRRLKPQRREGGNRDEGWDKTVVINIQSASNLPIRDSGQLQPFVMIFFAGKRVMTDVAIGRHPNWQFTSKIVIDDVDLEEEFIDIRVYDQIIEELDRDDRLHNVIHEQLTSRLIAATKIRFDTLTNTSKINSPIKLWLPEYISNYKMSTESSFLKILISTQIPSKFKLDYRQSQHTTENLKILEKCRELEETMKVQFPKRVYRPLVVDINAKSVFCSRYLRPINPPPIIMQESSKLKICQLSAKIVASLPRCEPGSHSDIWVTVDQLTTIAIVGGNEERAVLLACWLLHFKIRVWVLMGEKIGEKCGFLLVELENAEKILIDPTDGHLYKNIHDSNCGFENIWAAFDEKNYYANIQYYDNIQQISLNFQKTANWKPLLTQEPLESVQPPLVRYDILSDDWILELKIGLEREIKLKFDESRSHAIPQWNLVASRQLREILESPDPRNSVDDKIARLKDAYRIQLTILELAYVSIQQCVNEVLSTNMHLNPDNNAQFAVSVNIFPFFSHCLRVDIAIAVLKSKK